VLAAPQVQAGKNVAFLPWGRFRYTDTMRSLSTARSVPSALLAILFTVGCGSVPTDDSGPDPDAPQATALTIDGQGDSVQVRQGAGTVTLKVTGTHLDELTGASLGAWTATVKPGATATEATLAVDIPHGAAPGDVDLTVTGASGSNKLAAAVEITEITSAPAGADADGAGTPDHPYRSLKQALSVAASGDIIQLADGTYDVGNGESWPQHPTDSILPPPAANVPAGVIIQGRSSSGTILQGRGGSEADDGLVFAGDGGVRNLELTGFNRAIFAGTGHVVLERVNVVASINQALVVFGDATVEASRSAFQRGGGSGLVVRGASSLTMSTTEINGFLEHGVDAGDTATVKLVEVDVHDNGDGSSSNEAGVFVADGAQAELTVEKSKLHDNSYSGIRANAGRKVTVTDSDMYLNGKAVQGNQASYGLIAIGAEVTVRGGSAYQNGRDGIILLSTVRADISGVTLRDNWAAGLTFSDVGALKVRTTTIRDNTRCCGIYIAGANNGTLDFGTSTEAGQNEIDHPSIAVADDRPARAAANGAVATFKGSKINGQVLPAGVVTGPATVSPSYQISNNNNRLEF